MALELLRFGNLSDTTHFVSTRGGGFGQDPYASLNLGLHVGDDPDTVLKNRDVLGAAAGIDASRFAIPRQVHGANVVAVAEPEEGTEADAIITDRSGILLMVLVADCVPVLLHDPKRHAVAAIHAGWKGTAAGVVREAVRAMQERYGTDPADLVAGIGPSIGPCHSEVGAEVREQFPDFTIGDAIDVRAANVAQLRAAGVSEAHIESMDSCTFEDARFFSARRDGTTGRFGAGIALA